LLSAALPPPLLLALLCCRCCRDFTTAAIPWGEPDLSIVQGLLPAAGGTDGASNVLSISFDKMTYPVTVEGLHTVRAANPPSLHSMALVPGAQHSASVCM
jgi:hypothetical protein